MYITNRIVEKKIKIKGDQNILCSIDLYCIKRSVIEVQPSVMGYNVQIYIKKKKTKSHQRNPSPITVWRTNYNNRTRIDKSLPRCFVVKIHLPSNVDECPCKIDYVGRVKNDNTIKKKTWNTKINSQLLFVK